AVHVHGLLQRLPGFPHRVGRGAAGIVRGREIDTGEDALDLRLVLFQERLAFERDGEETFRAFGRLGADQVLFLEHGQRRIDGARTRRVGAGKALFHRADQVVAVPRLLADEGEQKQPEVAMAEHAPAPASAKAAPEAFGSAPAAFTTAMTMAPARAAPSTADSHVAGVRLPGAGAQGPDHFLAPAAPVIRMMMMH